MEQKDILNRLWIDYSSQNPSAKKIHSLFGSEGETVENDHIAFRTFNDSRINIGVLSKLFLQCGYEPCGTYFFEEKKLNAVHYENKKTPNSPRVFISELILENFSPSLQKTLRDTLNKVSEKEYNQNELIFSGNIWGKPIFETYQKLREESEYAAWVYVFGFRANHFTVSVNSLKKYDTVEKVNSFLKKNGFVLNSSGGEVKGTPQELLEQSSTLADIVEIEFMDGKHKIPACYYEFAKRYPGPDGQLYSAFIAKSADKIFESTNFYKK